MKKVFALALAMAMTLSLVACGSSDAPAASTPATSTPAASTPAAPADPAPQTYDVVWAGTSASSGYYALNVALCDIINTYVDGVTVTLMETGGTVDDYKLMRDGEAVFGQTSSVNEYCLQNQIALYEGFGYTDARDLAFFVPQCYRFTVTSDSGITSVSELAGKKYNAGLSGSSSELETMNILGVLGIEPDWYPASTADAIDAMSNRQIVGFTKSGTSLTADSTIANLMANVDVEFLSFTEEEAAKVNEVYPYYGFKVVDCSMYGKDYETLTYCANYGFCVDKSMPDDVVYEIVKAFDEHHADIKAAYPGIVDDPMALTADPVDVSLIHPGVVKYMQEKGIEVPANRIG